MAEQQKASDGKPMFTTHIDFGDDTGIHEESWGSEDQLRKKYKDRLPNLYAEAENDAVDARIFLWASEDDAAKGLPPIGEAHPVI
jgi:hypothetical protein